MTAEKKEATCRETDSVEVGLELWGRRVDNCWRLQMMVALKYVTFVSYGVD